MHLISETPEVIARFKKFWYEFSFYRKRTIEDRDPESVLEECMSLTISQLDILEERMCNITRVAEKIRKHIERV